MPVPSEYFYVSNPVSGSPGYWKNDGTGPYRFDGTNMVLMDLAGVSQIGQAGTNAVSSRLWDTDDASGPVTVRS